MRFTRSATQWFDAIRRELDETGESKVEEKAIANRLGFRFHVNETNQPQCNIRCPSVHSERQIVSRRFKMQIQGLGQLHNVQGINAPHINRIYEPTTPAAPSSIDTTDELHLSPAAELAGRMSEIPDVRWERVNSIKAAIADGTYMTDAKLDVALERLLDEIA
jgi:negative regulator of flagellin synthesis FlgM